MQVALPRTYGHGHCAKNANKGGCRQVVQSKEEGRLTVSEEVSTDIMVFALTPFFPGCEHGVEPLNASDVLNDYFTG